MHLTEEQKRYINYLAERVREADLGLRARDAVLQDFLDKQKEYDARLTKLDAVLAHVDSLELALRDELKKHKAAERKVDDLKRIESNLFEFLSVKTLSKIFNGCRDFFSMRPDAIFVQMSAEPNLFELCRVQPKITYV